MSDERSKNGVVPPARPCQTDTIAGTHKELRMSLINGDKSRDNRRHKKVVKMREKRGALKAKLAGAPQKKTKS